MSVSGRIGRRRATLRRAPDDRLMLDWAGLSVDLAELVVRHRDEDGRITFSITQASSGNALRAVRYRRKGPKPWNLLADLIDFTADEPWTWEDADFGLFVFHEATATGPVKFRHRIQPLRLPDVDLDGVQVEVDDEQVVRWWPGLRTATVRFADLTEIRVKFELSGIWAEAALLTLDSPSDLVVVDVQSPRRADLLARLRRLPGWDERADAAIADACEYAARDEVGPARGERWSSRAERPVWSRR